MADARVMGFDVDALAVASAVQAKALDAGRSVWISANAGTGKTEVLTRRLLALLLQDETLEPAHILAVTFTNAGAAEMAARLPERLRALAAMDAARLTEVLRADLGVEATPATQARVRVLAQAVQEAPPMISTLHGLAQVMLARFPREAGVPEGFALLDETERSALLMDIQNTLLVDVDDALADALGLLLDELGETGWRDLTGMMVARWRVLKGILAEGGVAGALGRISAELGLREGENWGAPLLPHDREVAALRAVVALEPGHVAADVLAASDAQKEAVWRGFLLTQKDEPRARIVVKKIAEALPDVAAVLADAAARVAEGVRQRKLWRLYDITQALLVWAFAVRGAYAQRKAERGLLDFDDLLDGLERLLDQTADGPAAEWVWYALDRRFRHLVVDEAQDNNAQQTRIIGHLAQNLLSGDVGEMSPRTVLAVGDVKQCIFHFQGARPDLFLALRDDLVSWSGGALTALTLTHNFRSGRAVLGVVDEVFADPEVVCVTTGDPLTPSWPTHKPVAAGRESRVEVWPLVGAPDVDDVAPWTLPQERQRMQGASAAHLLARQVASFIRGHMERGTRVPSTGNPLQPQDVLIVVQRNATAALFAGVLRAAGVPVVASAGVPSPVLADAVAMVRWVFNPADRIALVQVLKAYRGWGDAQVLALAAQAKAAGDAAPWHTFVAGDDAAWLARYAAYVEQTPAAMLYALGHSYGVLEVLEPLLEEAAAVPTWRGLVERLEQREQAGKPLCAPDTGEPGVRIMTVHGSKGLQAPLVILPETTRAMDDIRNETILWPVADGDGVLIPAADAGLSPLGVRLREGMKAQARTNALRGLYVALTRAMDWLVVCGWGDAEKVEKAGDTTWYGLVARCASGEVWRQDEGMRVRGDDLPSCAREEAPVAADPVLVWPETRVWEGIPVRVADAPSAAQVRGELVHALLQGMAVPDAPADVVAEAAAVRGAFPWMFTPDAEAEVVVGLCDGTVGRIDRMVRHEGVLWVIDFKTGQVPGGGWVPPVYVAQVKGYMAALVREGTVRGAIVWTAGPQFVDVTDMI